MNPITPASCNAARCSRLSGTAPPQNPVSTWTVPAAHACFASSARTSSVGGMEFSGMSITVVTPPAAAARVALANPSHSVRPGSFTCTWVSTKPGSNTSSSASSTTGRRVVGRIAVQPDLDDLAIAHADPTGPLLRRRDHPAGAQHEVVRALGHAGDAPTSGRAVETGRVHRHPGIRPQRAPRQGCPQIDLGRFRRRAECNNRSHVRISGWSRGGAQHRELAALIGRLAGSSTGVDDAERVDRIGLFESLKSAAAAAQARETTAFDASQRETQRAAGVRPGRVGQGIAAQVALARRESPARAARYIGWANILVRELPETFAALQRGEITEWRAMIVARESIWLTRDQRAIVDAELAPRIAGLGDREVEAEAKKIAYRLDPAGFLARSRNAERDRRVSLRPAPDTMARLTALLPVAQGVAAYAALAKAAATARAAGDQRGRGQVMADTLVERVTGQATAHGVPAVEINLVMTDHTLFNTDHPAHRPSNRPAPAVPADGGAERGCARSTQPPLVSRRYLVGYGPIPAGLARDLAHGSDNTKIWVRRLYTDPCTGQLAAIDTRRRPFPGHIRRAIIVRDQVCRTPWCGAPIRHTDHARALADGGQTSFANGQGLCEACNYAKQADGWSVSPGPGGTERIGAHHHPDRTHLHQPTTPPPRHATSTSPQTANRTGTPDGKRARRLTTTALTDRAVRGSR